MEKRFTFIVRISTDKAFKDGFPLDLIMKTPHLLENRLKPIYFAVEDDAKAINIRYTCTYSADQFNLIPIKHPFRISEIVCNHSEEHDFLFYKPYQTFEKRRPDYKAGASIAAYGFDTVKMYGRPNRLLKNAEIKALMEKGKVEEWSGGLILKLEGLFETNNAEMRNQPVGLEMDVKQVDMSLFLKPYPSLYLSKIYAEGIDLEGIYLSNFNRNDKQATQLKKMEFFFKNRLVHLARKKVFGYEFLNANSWDNIVVKEAYQAK